LPDSKGAFVKLLVIDDQQIYREGLRAVISRQPDMQVIAEAASAREGFPLAEAQRPDIIIVDLGLPGMDGLAATRELLRRHERGRVLVLTQHASEIYAAQAFAAGAKGYALKDQPAEEIVAAIHALARGETYLAPRLAQPVVERLLRRPDGGHPVDPLATLTPREREIFSLVARGFSSERIATELCISKKTVETHRARINKKLGVHSAAELVRLAASRGLLTE
jgi:DNA-binding NarL/FixJ family response regulator